MGGPWPRLASPRLLRQVRAPPLSIFGACKKELDWEWSSVWPPIHHPDHELLTSGREEGHMETCSLAKGELPYSTYIHTERSSKRYLQLQLQVAAKTESSWEDPLALLRGKQERVDAARTQAGRQAYRFGMREPGRTAAQVVQLAARQIVARELGLGPMPLAAALERRNSFGPVFRPVAACDGSSSPVHRASPALQRPAMSRALPGRTVHLFVLIPFADLLYEKIITE